MQEPKDSKEAADVKEENRSVACRCQVTRKSWWAAPVCCGSGNWHSMHVAALLSCADAAFME